MRPGIGSEQLIMAPLSPQVRAETVINRAAVGEVAVHVPERHAVVEGGRIALGIESIACQQLLGKPDALRTGSALGREKEICQRGVQSRRAEEIDESGGNIGSARAHI